MNDYIPEAIPSSPVVISIKNKPHKHKRYDMNQWVQHYLKAAIWGAMDGIITTFAVVTATDGVKNLNFIIIGRF
jgi:hypothetical protein